MPPRMPNYWLIMLIGAMIGIGLAMVVIGLAFVLFG